MLERLFSMVGMVVLPCWVLLAVAPRWEWSELLETFVAPLLVAALYEWQRIHLANAGGYLVQLAVCAVGRVSTLSGFRSLYRGEGRGGSRDLTMDCVAVSCC